MANYFACQSQATERVDDTMLEWMTNESILTNIQTTDGEVLTVVWQFKTYKAIGLEGISNDLLELICYAIIPSLTKLFNMCLNKQIFPDCRKRAKVTPIYKKGPKDTKTNYWYRPISLLSTVSKVFERIVFNRLYCYCKSHRIVTWRNSVCLKGDSTINQTSYCA